MKFERGIFLIILVYGLILVGMERPEASEPVFAIGMIAAACIASDPVRLRAAMTPLFAVKIATGLGFLFAAFEQNLSLALPLGEIASAVAIGAAYSRLRWPEKAAAPSRPAYSRPATLTPTLQLELVRQQASQRVER